jgi:hypothetical protein
MFPYANLLKLQFFHNITYNHSLQPTILNDNVNQFKVGLESDKGYLNIWVISH